MAKLARKDTVLLDEVVAKTQSKEFVDFVYNYSHLWSQRHPDRANEIIADDFVSTGFSKNPVKGKENIVKIFYAVHDSIEDFQFTITSVGHEGDLNDGVIIYEWIASGSGMKSFSDFKVDPSLFQKEGEAKQIFSLYGTGLLKVKGKKVQSGQIYLDLSRSSPLILKNLASMHKP